MIDRRASVASEEHTRASENGAARPKDTYVELLRANVERYTVRPAGGPGSAYDLEDHVVVSLLDTAPAAGFARAREISRAKGRVRLVGHGVTLPTTWPEWVRSEPGITLTELGAYRFGNVQDTTRALRTTYRTWVEDVFAGAAPKGAEADVYYAPVVIRLFQAVFEAQVFAGGFATLHGGSSIELVGRDRRAFESLAGTNVPPLRVLARKLALPPALAAAWFGATAITLRDCVRMRREAKRSLSALDARKADARKGEPRLWVGVVPDWYRMSKHIVDAAALPELSAGKPLGVLLLGSLRAGSRDDRDLKKINDAAELWPGLGELLPELERCVVAQAVQPESTSAYVKSVLAYVAKSARVGAKMIARRQPLEPLAASSGVIDVALRAAKAATLDVARSVLAERAADTFVRDHDVNGRLAVFAAANAAGFTSVDAVLKRNGATTAEHTHGSTGNCFYGGNESSAVVQCMWTEADKAALGGARECVVAGMPQTMKLRPRTATVPRRVLLLTNYVSSDSLYDSIPFEPFQDEMLRIVPLLEKALGNVFEFRWRPHPSDDDKAVARGLARVPHVDLSRKRSLVEDLDWCDVLVSAASTALVEAALGDVPIFVHAIPEFEAECSFMPPERRFFRAEELVPRFVAWVEALRRGDPNAGRADAEAKRALFGPDGRPRTLHEAFPMLRGA